MRQRRPGRAGRGRSGSDPGAFSPHFSAAAGIAVVFLLGPTGLLDELSAFAALVLAGTASCLAAGGVLFALEPRSLARPVLRKLRRPATA
ncbi:MAG: hypothetical protein ABWY96_07485 [Gaiellaceae bacterium]